MKKAELLQPKNISKQKRGVLRVEGADPGHITSSVRVWALTECQPRCLASQIAQSRAECQWGCITFPKAGRSSTCTQTHLELPAVGFLSPSSSHCAS